MKEEHRLLKNCYLVEFWININNRPIESISKITFFLLFETLPHNWTGYEGLYRADSSSAN